MALTFYFYDLETSGFSPRTARIMQFAGQRTDMDLQPIGPPDNILIKLSDDILPEPDATLVHGITPQLANKDGMTEPDFARYFYDKIALPNTIFTGFNNIRFDDEFIRFLLWRNFYDAYEWHWKDSRGRWDLLDASRMVRALRPAGIEWPFASDGRSSNRLELLSSINKITHDSVHDALSDVTAMIAFAELIKAKQPKLFRYLLKMRDKSKVAILVEKGHPFIYVSGRYPSEFEKATVAVMVTPIPERDASIVYDLRTDPEKYLKMSAAELAKCWTNRDKDADYFPIKKLSYNRCPTVAPISVLDKASRERLKLDMAEVQANLNKLLESPDFGDKLLETLKIVEPPRQPEMVVDEQKVDELLYDGFVDDDDRVKIRAVRSADVEDLAKTKFDFHDERLKALLPIYKARNYPESLDADEKAWWQTFRQVRLKKTASRFNYRLQELLKQPDLHEEHKHLLKELEAYAEAILPKS